MPNDDTLIIANPQSAGAKLGKRWDTLAATIEAEFGRFEHRFTRSIGDAKTLAQEATESGRFSLIVAMGGDGTVSEVVDGMFSAERQRRPALGILPFGTGGDFRRTIGMPRELASACRRLAKASLRQIDLGRLTFGPASSPITRHFVNIASFGLSGLVDQLANQSSKRWGGTATFAWATLRAMRRFSAPQVKLTLDDRPPVVREIQTIAVANGRFFGGGMQIAPNAALDDGLFDVVTLSRQSMLRTLSSGRRIYRGTHLDLPGVSVERAATVLAEPIDEAEILLDVDGETPGRLPARFDLLPGVLALKAGA